MTRPCVLATLLIVLCSEGVAYARHIRGYVGLRAIRSTFTSVGEAQYINDLMQPESAELDGEHAVNQVSPSVLWVYPVSGSNGKYYYELTGPAQADQCYGTTLHVVADPPGLLNTTEHTFYGDTRCAETSDLPSKDLPDDGGGSGGYTSPPAYTSPILVDLDDDGFELTALSDGVVFDLDADGTADRISWTAAGVSDSFLVLDRNGNGVIDDGQELFGSATRLASGNAAQNGYLALRELDGNRDGMIDRSDAIWPSLQVWTDRNHDAVSQSSELQSLAAAGIYLLDTQYSESHRTDKYGNRFRFKARALVTDKHNVTHTSKTYDVFFMQERR